MASRNEKSLKLEKMRGELREEMNKGLQKGDAGHEERASTTREDENALEHLFLTTTTAPVAQVPGPHGLAVQIQGSLS